MSGQQGEERQVVPIVEERLEVRTREVERGRVQVRIRVEDREELAEAVLRQEDVTVERVPLGHPVEAPPPVREEDGVLVVPVLEERLVVRTQLILKEELRIVRARRTERVREPVRDRHPCTNAP
jgi:stress response protein YsnF